VTRSRSNWLSRCARRRKADVGQRASGRASRDLREGAEPDGDSPRTTGRLSAKRFKRTLGPTGHSSKALRSKTETKRRCWCDYATLGTRTIPRWLAHCRRRRWRGFGRVSLPLAQSLRADQEVSLLVTPLDDRAPADFVTGRAASVLLKPWQFRKLAWGPRGDCKGA
jgi:hypothetical protein